MTATETTLPRPRLSRAGLTRVHQVEVVDQRGQPGVVSIPGESPLTIKVDGREIVTLMTLGTNPEELALGYLRNQRLLNRIEEIESVSVDWSRGTADVRTRHGRGIPNLDEIFRRVTVTSSGGLGTLSRGEVDKLREQGLPRVRVRQSTVYRVLEAVATRNVVYRQTGSVHNFSLCQGETVLMSAEDVGRHNAADVIAGRMWLDGLTGEDKILFTTGRLSSEMVMKTALMDIPVLVSRSGATNRGLELARDTGMVLIGRAEAAGFVVYNGADQVVFDLAPNPDRPA